MAVVEELITRPCEQYKSQSFDVEACISAITFHDILRRPMGSISDTDAHHLFVP
jgi:hypothetical protein